jgi:hypothetical protein
MHPPVLDPLSKHACLNLAADPPLPQTPAPPTGRNALCTLTYPGENQRPSAWSGADQGGDWYLYDDPCGQPYDGGTHYNESWQRESYRCPAPHYNDRRWDEHAPLPYNYQSSSPYRTSLYVTPRGPARDAFDGRHQASSMGNFQDFGAFQDAVQRKIQRVSLLVR